MSLSFNASVEVTEVVLRSLENVSKDLAKRCILECALRHNFDAEEELRILGLDNVTVIRKKSEKKPIIKQKPVLKFCLPFLAETVDENGCNGIAFNEGLYTQCKKVRIENETFCKMCLGESKVSENGEPKNGTVTRRSNSPYYSYEDNRGRMPPSYQDYMKKRGITQEEVLAEAEKQGLTIPLEHFASFTRSKKVVKKSKKGLILEEDEEKEDLFADLQEETLEELSDNVPVLDDYLKAQKEAEKAAEREAKALEKAKEKEQQKAEREAKAAQDKAEREAKAAQDKAEKAAQREAKKAQEKADREAKAALEKAEREAKIAQKAQEKADKEAKAEQEKVEKAAKLAQDKADAKAARETKLAEEKAERAAKVAQEKADKLAQKTQKPVQKPVEKVVEDTAPKKVTVKRITIEGKQYLKTVDNLLYDPETKEEMGIYEPETNTIKALPDDDEDELEEDDVSDDE